MNDDSLTPGQLRDLANTILAVTLECRSADEAVGYINELANLRERLARASRDASLEREGWRQGREEITRLRCAAYDLIDAIARPEGKDFRTAWDSACRAFDNIGAEPLLFQSLSGKACDCGLGPCSGACKP